LKKQAGVSTSGSLWILESYVMSDKTTKPFATPYAKSLKDVKPVDSRCATIKEAFVNAIEELGRDLEIKLVMEACYEIADGIASLMDHTPEGRKNIINVHPLQDIPQGLRNLAHRIQKENTEFRKPVSDSLTWVYGTQVGCLGKPMMNVDMAAVYATFDMNVGLARMMRAALSQTSETE
jgi:capsule polysaccharide modification protein KpsS